jgi:hypothetical protein
MKKFFAMCFLCLALACLAASCSSRHTHEYGDWITVQKLTCNDDGLQERYCYCLEKETRQLEAKGHQYPETPNCVENQYCLACNVILEYGTSHQFDKGTVTKSPTCTEKGEKECVCVKCGQKDIQTVYPTGHKYGQWTVVKPATCTENGKQEKACVCGKKETKEIQSTGHSFSEWTTLKAATCTEDGMKERACACGEKETAVIPAAHAFTEVVLKEATRTEEGRKSMTCTICGFQKEEAIPVIVSHGLSYSVNKDGITCTIKGLGTCTDTNIIIPHTIDGYRVVAIADAAFSQASHIVEIVIPDTVLSIGSLAFRGCAISEIVIPDSVTEIGTNIFLECGQLERIVLGSGLTSLYTPFFQKMTLKSFVIACNITKLENFALNEFTALESIILPETLTSIGSSAFAECKNLKEIIIPASVESIGGWAFQSCRSLTSVTLPEGITNVNEWLFYSCLALEDVYIPESVLVIGQNAFLACIKLENIRFGGTMAQWEQIYKDESWNSDSAIKTITCTDGIITIG